MGYYRLKYFTCKQHSKTIASSLLKLLRATVTFSEKTIKTMASSYLKAR